MAQRLAAAGHAVMRFDYRGSGESGGKAAHRRWEHLSQDVATVRKTLARLSGKRDSALLGLRAGATVALLESIRVGGESVIALAPIVSGATQVRLWRMRSKIKSELTVDTESQKSEAPKSDNSDVLDFDGFPVHPGFFDDVARIDLVKDLGRLSCPGLIAQVSHREDPAPESVKLMETLGPRATLKCIRMEPFWDKIDDVDTAPLEDLALKFLGES
jgi:pimeloyl-ACP methyl ester carboxylesterase